MKTVVIVAAVQCIAFSSAGLAQAQDAPNMQLTWVDREGHVIETAGAAGPYRGAELAPDGKRFALHIHPDTRDSSHPGGGDVLIFEPGARFGRRITGDGSSTIENTGPIWSPDGTRIVYGSMRNGKGGLYVKRADGSGREELLNESETTKLPMSWSPDGKCIVYWTPGNVQWVLPLTGDRTPFQLSKGQTSHAQISPDGKWVAYVDQADESAIYVRPFSTDSRRGNDAVAAVRVSKDGGVFPRWRGDSRELYFLSGQANGKMMAADIAVNGSTLQASTPHALFDSGYANPGHTGGIHHGFAVTFDGRRFLIPRRDQALPLNDRNLRTLTLFDRRGNTIGTVGERGAYTNPSLSPDGSRVALLKNDQAANTVGIWVIDISSGKPTLITSGTRQELVQFRSESAPIWSPDGTKLAYVATRRGTKAIYRKSANGTGDEDLVFTPPASDVMLQEWTSDGRLTYYVPQLGGNVEFALPTTGEPKPSEIVRSAFPILAARLSPDNHFIAFRSNESGRDEIWVRRLDPSGKGTDKWQVSSDGGTAPVYWRSDGKELYYLSRDRGIMAVPVWVEPDIAFDTPRLLFKIPEAFPADTVIAPWASMMTLDGERFLLSVPPAPLPPYPLPQLTLVDRQGKSIKRLDQGVYFGPVVFSTDGARVLGRKSSEKAGDSELRSFAVTAGADALIARGPARPSAVWAPDGKQVFYLTATPDRGQSIITRRSSDGSGNEEEIYRHLPGTGLFLNDVSPDGQFLAFESGDVINMLPLTGPSGAERTPIEFTREEYSTSGARFSPDGRFIAYVADETGRPEIYIRPVDPTSGKAVGEVKWQVTTDGLSSPSMLSWRRDGHEIYYSKPDLNGFLMMAVAVSPGPTFHAGKPRFLFYAQEPRAADRDGQHFVTIVRPWMPMAR